LEVEYQVVYTNKVPGAVVRGAGRPQAVFVMERMVDRVARELRLDPAEVRRRNFIQPEEFPYNVGITYRDGSSLTYDSGNYPACLAKALEMIDYEHLKLSLAEERTRGKCVGVGMAYYVEGSGLGPYEGAAVRVDPSGKVVVSTGASPQGQSHETTLAQICADELGISMDDVRIVTGDTSSIAFGIGTFASRIGVVAGAAVTLATRAVREKAMKIGAVLLKANPEDLEYREGSISVKGSPQRQVSLAHVALVASGPFPGSTLPKGIEPGLQETRYFNPPQATYTNGAHIAVVEGDPELAQVKILRYVVAHDCGTMINPMVVDGQIQGGVAHGIGDSLYEEVVYDDSGQLLTGSYMDYLLPTASEVPGVEIAHLETPSPFIPGGMKGAGEGGTIPVAATLAAAIEDAFSNYGIRITELPINPGKLRCLIKGKKPDPH
jgi:carbon-monoxide dehydrogenase large subunit